MREDQPEKKVEEKPLSSSSKEDDFDVLINKVVRGRAAGGRRQDMKMKEEEKRIPMINNSAGDESATAGTGIGTSSSSQEEEVAAAETATNTNQPGSNNSPQQLSGGRKRVERAPLEEPPQKNTGGEGGVVSLDEFDVMKVVALRSRETIEETSDGATLVEGGAGSQNTTTVFPNKRGVRYYAMDGREPGAYSGAPGASLHRCDNPRFSQVGIIVQSSPLLSNRSDTESGINMITNDNNGGRTNINSNEEEEGLADGGQEKSSTTIHISTRSLVEASPIMDEQDQEELITAQPMETPVQDIRQKEMINSQKEKRWIGIGVLLALLCLVVCLSVVYGRRRGSGSSGGDSESPSLAPSSSMIPTASPTRSLSWLDPLLETLPNSTLANVYRSPRPPSAHAFEWMVDNRRYTKVMEVWRQRQLFALVSFFYAFEGPHWPEPIHNDWLVLSDTETECLWFSSYDGTISADGHYYTQQGGGGNDAITCDSDGEYEVLVIKDLRVAEYNPVVPPEIGLLTKLHTFGLYEGGINASLNAWSGLFQLTNLQLLTLNNNNIHGTIPSNFGILTNLEDMNLRANTLTSWLPSELGAMISLSSLDLSNNLLSGAIPSQLALMESLVYLDLSNNLFTGAIPSQLALMESLAFVDISNNLITADVPMELAMKDSLFYLNVSNNRSSRN